MEEVKWTKEQKQAIEQKGNNILVAAAAGSGKTAVLVERIINKILNQKIDIDKLLVVTFTNAAAAEMRERVLKAIYKKQEKDPENEELQKQIILLNKSNICTIDSFCLEIVRNNFYEIDNISPNFRIADSTEIELLKQETIEDIFEQKYEEENEDFNLLINTYTSYRDDEPLKDIVLKIFNYIQSNPYPHKWLNEKVEMFNLEGKINTDFSKTIWGEILLEQVEEILIDSILNLEEVAKQLKMNPDLNDYYITIRDDIDKLSALKNNLDNWDKAYKINQKLKFVDWPRKKVDSLVKDTAKKTRDDIKKKLQKVLDKILISNSMEANQDIFDMYKKIKKLQDLIIEFETEFTKRKREKNIVDFSDIEHLALKILLKEDEDGKIIPTDVAKRYQNKFEEIAIDEYQDSNLVQEFILKAVSKNNNIFMVGDVKQSIYKFRQAMPELFLKKYNYYKTIEKKCEKDNLKIQLFKNFRSRKNVLDSTNIIFENIMSSLLGEIEYNEEEYLNLGASYPESKENLKTEIHVIDTKEEEKEGVEDQKEKFKPKETSEIEEIQENERIEDIEVEAKFVSQKIKDLIKNKFQIWDSKKGCYREISYKDIVVLLRATSKAAPIFERAMIEQDVPVFSDSSQEYLDSIEIQTIISLLKIIDNPLQDIPLVAILRSPIGKFTDNELIEIRLSDKYDNFYNCLQKAEINVNEKLKNKIIDFFDKLNMWRKDQEYLALDELIWKIYNDTSYYNYVGLMPNGELRQANLKMLFEKARQFESANFKGLYHFIKFIDKLKLNKGDFGTAKIIGENDDVVRIMSIHKSKGLEFPVVFLSNTGKQINLMDMKQNLLLHQELGIGVKYIDYDKQVQYDTLTKVAIQNKVLTETLSEEMRILYVVLTRAKEKLIITSTSKDIDKDIEKIKLQIERYSKTNDKINPILVKKYRRYIDWILLTYFYNIEQKETKDVFDFKIVKKKEVLQSIIDNMEEDNKEEFLERLNNYIPNEETQEKLNEMLEYEYPNLIATKIPGKASVTQLKSLKTLLDDSSTKIKKYEKEQEEEKTKEKEKEDVKVENNVSFQKPKFLNKDEKEKITAAQKGTLIHLCLQKLDEKQDYTLETIKNMIEDLAQREIITRVEADNINPNVILKFTKSKIWKELKTAKQINRETPFYMNIPAREIYDENLEEKILVQGIVDLFYIDENDNIVLVDYKTDYVEDGNEQELINKYGKQLELYKKAIESAYGKKVDRVYIYSTFFGEPVRY